MDLKINPGFYYFLFASLKWRQIGSETHAPPNSNAGAMPQSTEPKSMELAVKRLLSRAVKWKLAPSWTLRGWSDLQKEGRAFVVERLEALGVTATSLPDSLPFESVCIELRRVSSVVRMWMARLDAVAPELVALVADRMVEARTLTADQGRLVSGARKTIARELGFLGCTSEGLYMLLVSSPVDARIEPLAVALIGAACLAE
jgi:hypothetical protein